MTASPHFYDLLISLEGLSLTAYKDSADIPTIGIGTTHYPNGFPVQMGDTCTKESAYKYAEFEADHKAGTLNGLLNGVDLQPNQFDALLSLVYNIGTGAFAASTLLRRVRGEAGDIREGFLMWNKAHVNGVLQVVKGLTERRNKEADLYLGGELIKPMQSV